MLAALLADNTIRVSRGVACASFHGWPGDDVQVQTDALKPQCHLDHHIQHRRLHHRHGGLARNQATRDWSNSWVVTLSRYGVSKCVKRQEKGKPKTVEGKIFEPRTRSKHQPRSPNLNVGLSSRDKVRGQNNRTPRMKNIARQH